MVILKEKTDEIKRNYQPKVVYSKSTLEALKRMGFNHPDYEG